MDFIKKFFDLGFWTIQIKFCVIIYRMMNKSNIRDLNYNEIEYVIIINIKS